MNGVMSWHVQIFSVYLITKFALANGTKGLTVEASRLLTVSLVNYDAVCFLLRYLHPGGRHGEFRMQ